MTEQWISNKMSWVERQRFETDGFIVIRNALSDSAVDELERAICTVYAQALQNGHSRHDHFFLADLFSRDQVFADLVDCEKTFPSVFQLLGWNVYCYHSHLGITPPCTSDDNAAHMRLRWHRDGGRLNWEIESSPQPRVAIKVGFFVSDATERDSGNLLVVKGSHLYQERPEGSCPDPKDALPVCARRGDAVVFDRRLWHATCSNMSSEPRIVVYLGYSYRWLRPKDAMTNSSAMQTADEVRRQLLGEMENANDAFNPPNNSTPLKAWLMEWSPQDVGQDDA